jgi:hypothetical protein
LVRKAEKRSKPNIQQVGQKQNEMKKVHVRHFFFGVEGEKKSDASK